MGIAYILKLLYIYMAYIICPVCATNETEDNGLPEVCDTEVFEAACADDQVVVITHALYGRMQKGRCVQVDLGYLGCHSDVTILAGNKCSGRTSCEIRVPDADFKATKPCLKELVMFLQISYKCVRVDYFSGKDCAGIDQVNITNATGYLASAVTAKSSCGDTYRPWVIQALPGQTIDFTLHDYSARQSTAIRRPGGETIGIGNCRDYGSIHDVGQEGSHMICGGVAQVKHVYHSKSNEVRVSFTNTKDSKDNNHFLLQYEIHGCADLSPPEGTAFKRHSSTRAEMWCINGPELKWDLLCQGFEWIGSHKNCSAIKLMPEEDKHVRPATGISYGIAAAIIIGAALGIGLIIVCVGIIRYRRRRRRHLHQMSYNRDTASMRRAREDQVQLKCTCPTNARPARIDDRDSDLVSDGGFSGTSDSNTMRNQKTIRINGNEYEHIWESPLPTPSGSASLQSSSKDSAYTSYKTDKSDSLTKEKPLYVSSKDNCSGNAKYTVDTNRYSVLKTFKKSSPTAEV